MFAEPAFPARLGLGRPRSREVQAARRDGPEEPVPDLGVAVTEHDRHDAVVPDDAPRLGEGARKHRVVELARPVVADAGPAPLDDDLLGLLLHSSRVSRQAEVRVRRGKGALQPDVEEVGGVRVVDHVVVWRVGDDGVDACRIGKRQRGRRPSADERRSAPWACPPGSRRTATVSPATEGQVPGPSPSPVSK